MIGRTFSHYRILEKIGEGGMGEVFLAHDTSLDRKVALKFLSEPLEQDETARKRFIREARSAAALDHPFICSIHEVGEGGGKHFIVMEYVEGETLKEKLEQGPLSQKAALQTAVEIAEALEKAHQGRIIHHKRSGLLEAGIRKRRRYAFMGRGHVLVQGFRRPTWAVNLASRGLSRRPG
jgi:serine/threonine protein kinase